MAGKKICFIATHSYPLFNPQEKSFFGGSEVQLYTIAKELAKDTSKSISFVVGNFGQKKYEYYDNVKVIRSFNPKSSGSSVLGKGFLALRYFLILIKESPDVCITSSAHSTVGVVSFYSKVFRKKHIHRVANIIDVNGYWVERNGFLGKVYNYGIMNASYVVCQTYEQKEALKKNYDIDATLFRNVFDFDSISNFKKNYVLWVGRASRSKRAEHFLKLAKDNPDLDFLMICNRQDEVYFDQIATEASKIKNLKFIEKVPFQKIQKYFDEASVFVSTSEFEGFANTFIQAGLGRTPILSLGSNPDNFITNYDCGYFANNSLMRLNEDLRKIISDEKQYQRFSDNIYNYVKQKYDIRKNIKVIENIIDNALVSLQ